MPNLPQPCIWNSAITGPFTWHWATVADTALSHHSCILWSYDPLCSTDTSLRPRRSHGGTPPEVVTLEDAKPLNVLVTGRLGCAFGEILVRSTLEASTVCARPDTFLDNTVAVAVTRIRYMSCTTKALSLWKPLDSGVPPHHTHGCPRMRRPP